MDNQTIRQFPEIMKGKKLMYVHGFGSSGQTNTVRLLRQFLPNTTVIAPDIPVHPHEGIALLKDVAATERPDIIMGTSMGGMYTEQLKGFDRICINPAFCIADTMQEHGLTGKQVFQNPRQDGVQEFMVTKSMVKEYKEVSELCFQEITPEERQRVWGLFGDEDPLVHTFDLYSGYYPTAIRFHGEHRLNDKVLLHYVLPIIQRIDDRQESRGRRSIYVDINAMNDSRGNAAPSLLKAYRYLMEYYSMFIVAPAPMYDADYYRHVTEWVDDVVSAPAYGRLIFTNDISQIFCDYLISREVRDDFSGTALQLGSGDFKTWEEVMEFFSRLGGQ